MQRPSDWPPSPSSQVPAGDMEFISGEGNDEPFDSQFFYNELEDMSGWFDLNWMLNVERGELAGYDTL